MPGILTTPSFRVLIPARMASTRFPKKMLALLAGMPVLERTYRQAMQSGAEEVVIVTDHKDLRKLAEGFGARVLMTDPDLPSGTDRCAAGLLQLPAGPSLVVNVQGDEPFIDPAHIDTVAAMLASGADIATLALPITQIEDLASPNTAKVLLDRHGFAMMFSRYPLPYRRASGGVPDPAAYPHLRHVGIYGFQTHVLEEVVKLPTSPLELMESLEQLRWLEAGYRIRVGLVEGSAPGIDTPEDLAAAERWLTQQQAQ